MPAGSLCHKKNDTIQNAVTILCFFLLVFLLPFLGGEGGLLFGILGFFVFFFFVFLSVFEIYLKYFTMMS